MTTKEAVDSLYGVADYIVVLEKMVSRYEEALYQVIETDLPVPKDIACKALDIE